MRYFILLSVLFLFCGSVLAQKAPCRFAPQFDTTTLLSDPSARDRYLRYVMHYEGMFGDVGMSKITGLTYDGTGIDYKTGAPASPLHYWTAASKESIQLMLLARALYGDSYAQIFFSEGEVLTPAQVDSKVLTILETKMTTFERWNSAFPGFGGFLPWVDNNASGVVPMPAWTNSVPALDNGEMIWALYSCEVSASLRTDSRALTLAHRLRQYLRLLATTAPVVFYAGNGHIRAVTTIKDPFSAPVASNYGMDCDGQPSSNCYLDDPYEGELFAVFMDLYSHWPNATARDDVWIAKRAKLQRVEYSTPSGPITVQRGWWFSSHEQWKYLELPYLAASPTNRRVFMNGERARTQHSASLKVPGLYASVTDVCPPGQLPPTYISATGIQSIAFEPVLRRDVVTPYGAFPVMLADLGIGLAWYNMMLQGSSMQGPLGSTEATNVEGTMISPVVTWDSKITSVVAMLNGVSDIVQRGLIRDKTFARFASVIEREWSRVFPEMKGEEIPLALPAASIPHTPQLGDFLTCHL